MPRWSLASTWACCRSAREMIAARAATDCSAPAARARLTGAYVTDTRDCRRSAGHPSQNLDRGSTALVSCREPPSSAALARCIAGTPSSSSPCRTGIGAADRRALPGVIETQLKPDGRGYNYRLTEAGADLAGVITALASWGQRWVEVTREQSDPAYALWAWCQVQLDRSALPDGRTVVASRFPKSAPAIGGFGY